MARRILTAVIAFMISLVLVGERSTVLGQDGERIVGLSHWSGQALLAVSDTGHWFAQQFQGDVWTRRTSVFDEAGVSDPAPIVAFDNLDWGGTNSPVLLDREGGIYRIVDVGTSEWSYQGNIVELTGHAASGPFVDLAVFDGNTLVAVTEGGDWYAKPGFNQPWAYRSNIFETSGPVTNEPTSMGSLRSRYRH